MRRRRAFALAMLDGSVVGSSLVSADTLRATYISVAFRFFDYISTPVNAILLVTEYVRMSQDAEAVAIRARVPAHLAELVAWEESAVGWLQPSGIGIMGGKASVVDGSGGGGGCGGGGGGGGGGRRNAIGAAGSGGVDAAAVSGDEEGGGVGGQNAGGRGGGGALRAVGRPRNVVSSRNAVCGEEGDGDDEADEGDAE